MVLFEWQAMLRGHPKTRKSAPNCAPLSGGRQRGWQSAHAEHHPLARPQRQRAQHQQRKCCRQTTLHATCPPSGRSVIVALELMPNGTNNDSMGVTDLKHGNVARPAERNEEFAHECTLSRLSATERTMGQKLARLFDRRYGSPRDFQVSSGTVQFTFQYMVKQSLQVFYGFRAEDDVVAHACLPLRAAASFASNLAITACAEMPSPATTVL